MTFDELMDDLADALNILQRRDVELYSACVQFLVAALGIVWKCDGQ